MLARGHGTARLSRQADTVLPVLDIVVEGKLRENPTPCMEAKPCE